MPDLDAAQKRWINDPDHTPRTVTPYRDGNISGYLPHIEDHWSEAKKMQHKAAIVRYETGINIQVKPAQMWCDNVGMVGLYGYTVRYAKGGFTSGGGHTFAQMWDWLNGFTTGARAIIEEIA